MGENRYFLSLFVFLFSFRRLYSALRLINLLTAVHATEKEKRRRGEGGGLKKKPLVETFRFLASTRTTVIPPFNVENVIADLAAVKFIGSCYSGRVDFSRQAQTGIHSRRIPCRCRRIHGTLRQMRSRLKGDDKSIIKYVGGIEGSQMGRKCICFAV